MPFYPNPIIAGIDHVASLGDGYTINIRWFQAYPTNQNNNIAYHIYYATKKENVYSEGVKLISIDSALEANIIDLTPGQDYYFSVRPVEYSSTTSLDFLPISHDNLRVYPSSILTSNISESSLIIPLLDASEFPSSGIVKVGVELIQYSSISSNSLILNSSSQRGYYNTKIRPHYTDGYDGYYSHSEIVSLWGGNELLTADRIYICQSRFEYPNHAFTIADGYFQVQKDILTSDLTASDESNVDFPSYDYSGYHRTDIELLLNGGCVGSYIGGEVGCIDKYGNVNMVRGMPLQDRNNQNQELLLGITGRPVVLLKRTTTGVVCSCYQPSSEYHDERCPLSFGTKFTVGYEQYFNPRRSDGRLLVRVGPTEENVKMYEAGLESEYSIDLWTLTVPTIKPRDVIVMFDIEDNEEFRYEVSGVTRNNTILGMQGGQKFKAIRIRKTDTAYQIPVFRNTKTLPYKINTGIGFTTGITPHTHTITGTNSDPLNWTQITSMSQGHTHEVRMVEGVLTVIPALGHTHQLIV